MSCVLCCVHVPVPLASPSASAWVSCEHVCALALSITVLFASVGRSQVPCGLLAITSAGHVQQCQRPLPHQVRGWRLHSRADHPRRKGLRRERLEEERPLFRNTLAGFNLNLLARRSIGGDKKAVAAVSIYPTVRLPAQITSQPHRLSRLERLINNSHD